MGVNLKQRWMNGASVRLQTEQRHQSCLRPCFKDSRKSTEIQTSNISKVTSIYEDRVMTPSRPVAALTAALRSQL